MINGPVGTRLWNWLNRKYAQGTCGELEPEHKLCQIIQGDLLPVKLLL
jgi:hypothetical protein